jgi:anti-sigma factor ChrR (cupin superfamily)
MKINADFDQRVVVHSEDLDWVPSPMAGVDRRALDRVGDEVARATTIVRYAPGSEFSPHEHTGGEEFVVLEGVFQDEHGDFPAGSYIRNPPQSSHKPGSEPGCVIFVKLWQFDLDDRTHVRLRTDHMFSIPHRDMQGVEVTPLYQDEYEQVSMQTWEAHARVELDFPGGAEYLVLDGDFEEQGDLLTKHSWLRIPAGGSLSAKVGENGARVWVKVGHLHQVARDIKNVSNR